LNWSRQKQIIVHAASQKLMIFKSYYGYLNLAFACIGGFNPKIVKTKQNIIAFQQIKKDFIGALSTISKKHLLKFQYKLFWLTPSAGLNITNASGIKFFAFVELDKLDYKTYDDLQELELHFIKYVP
jgi:hypothetical protein